MGQKGVLRLLEGNLLAFFCPGCKCAHHISDKWNFNENYESPTFIPSILVTGMKHLTDEQYTSVMNGETITPIPFICHSFITDGKISFLDDSTHELAGKTIALEAF